MSVTIAGAQEPREKPLDAYGTRPGPFQATAIMVGNVLYLSTMYTRVAALDPETDAGLWTFDPRAYEGGPEGAGPSGFKHRGVVFLGGGEPYLYAFDKATGAEVWRHAVPNERQPDDLPLTFGAAVRRHRDGFRGGRRARRLCAAGIAGFVPSDTGQQALAILPAFFVRPLLISDVAQPCIGVTTFAPRDGSREGGNPAASVAGKPLDSGCRRSVG